MASDLTRYLDSLYKPTVYQWYANLLEDTVEGDLFAKPIIEPDLLAALRMFIAFAVSYSVYPDAAAHMVFEVTKLLTTPALIDLSIDFDQYLTGPDYDPKQRTTFADYMANLGEDTSPETNSVDDNIYERDDYDPSDYYD